MKNKKVTSKKMKTPAMNCGGKKGGCYITLMPTFALKKAA